MSGFNKLLKMYGQMDVKDQYGNIVTWAWDYNESRPRIKSEMSVREIRLSNSKRYER